MRLLEFHYNARKKSFYVDGHEREDVVADRTSFCKQYLTEYEPYCRRWVQLSMNEAKTIKDLDVSLDAHGLSFTLITGLAAQLNKIKNRNQKSEKRKKHL